MHSTADHPDNHKAGSTQLYAEHESAYNAAAVVIKGPCQHEELQCLFPAMLFWAPAQLTLAADIKGLQHIGQDQLPM